jgi:GntR family phosphonate transport system transcriptional regulator
VTIAKHSVFGKREPLWKQIESDLLDGIRSGRYARGQRLPAALKLARDFDVNRHTVRRALAVLEERGLLRTEVGRGTFVCEETYDYRIGRRTSFTQNMQQLNVESDNRVLGVAQVAAPARVAQLLGLVRGGPVWRVESSAIADRTAIDHCEAYFPAARFPGLDHVFERTRSVTRTLAEYGIDNYFRTLTKVSAQLPSAVTARVLGQPVARPVLQVESLNVDSHGIPVQYGLTYFAGERVHLVVASDN